MYVPFIEQKILELLSINSFIAILVIKLENLIYLTLGRNQIKVLQPSLQLLLIYAILGIIGVHLVINSVDFGFLVLFGIFKRVYHLGK